MTWAAFARRGLARCLRVHWLVLGLCACAPQSSKPTGGETHFLRSCKVDSNDCGEDLECQCGVCTRTCSAADTCSGLLNAVCVAPSEADQCGAPVTPYCDVRCDEDDDCAVLPAAPLCVQGVCRSEAPLPEVDAAPDEPDAVPGEPDAALCSAEPVPGNALVILGDSFFAAGHQVAAFLEAEARSAGVLAVGERYRDNSLLAANALALTSPGIAEQYATAQADGAVQVVVMTGGGADILLGSCETVNASCPVIANAAAAATALFAQMATDGVGALIYTFYPDPVNDVVRAKLDALRPLIQSACASSPVPCHWLDLRENFAGHAEYIDMDGINPTAAGAEVAASAIWGVMQDNCIAQ
jgi:hypothetical protein